MHDNKAKILVLGGYGTLGKRICMQLALDPSYQIIIAGRNEKKGQDLAIKIKKSHPQAALTSCLLDWQAPNFTESLKNSQAILVIHAAGPFQAQDYTVAKACLELNMHYVDMADAREFVTQIRELDALAKEKGMVILSGASSVPGLSSVVVDTYASRFSLLREIDFGMVAGNKTERGYASIAAMLGYTGKSFQRLEGGRWKTVFGWQNIHRHYYGDNIGLRWHANGDIPDLILLTERYPKIKTVTYHTGLELTFLHFMLWCLAGLARINMMRNWVSLGRPITAISGWLRKMGTDKSGMTMRLTGSNHDYQPQEVIWTLVAEKGDGVYIPVMVTLLMVKKILQGLILPGAQPCLGMFSLEEFTELSTQWHIYQTLQEKEL